MRGLSRAALLAPTLLLMACASNPLPVRDANAAEAIMALKQRVLDLQRQVTVHELEIERLQARLARLEGGSISTEERGAPGARPDRDRPPAERASPSPSRPSPPPAPRRSEADRGSHIESTDLPTTDLDLAPAPPPPLPPARRPEAGGTGAGGPGAREPEAGTGSTARSGEQPASAAAQALYDQGYTLYHQGRYVDAEATFQIFLRSYGDTDLADNAGYWIGESRYARGDFRGALAVYRETLEEHPEGNKVPDILLKMGICLENLDNLADARDVYDELIRRFSGSAASVTAEQRRAALP